MSWKDKRAEYIKSLNKGMCLIPKPGREVPSCHENEYCECDMCDSYQAGYIAAINDAAKECDDRAHTSDSISNAAYRQGARDCAVFIRGSVNRTYSIVERF